MNNIHFFKKRQNTIISPPVDDSYWHNDTLTINGNYQPGNEWTEYTERYKSYKVGALICMDITTPQGNGMGWRDPRVFDIRPNIEEWAAQCVEAECKYAVLTMISETGFHLFDNPIPLNIGTYQIEGVTYPKMQKYDISKTIYADKNIVDNFFYEFRKVGIEPIPYLCTVMNSNLATVGTKLDSLPTDKLLIYNNWVAKTLQYLVHKYELNYLWLDNYYGYTYCDFQKYYNAIKTINPNCLMVGNVISDTDFAHYPYDIGSHEEYFSFPSSNWAAVFNTDKVHGGNTYKIVQEGVTNVTGQYGTNYYHMSIPIVARPIEQLQTFYDHCKDNNANFLLAMIPDAAGIITQSQIDAFKNIIR